MRAVNRYEKGGKTKRLEQLADKLVLEGLGGNVQAMKEIGDRLEGRAAQPIVGDKDQPITISIVKFT